MRFTVQLWKNVDTMPLKVHPLRIMVIAWSNVTDTKENHRGELIIIRQLYIAEIEARLRHCAGKTFRYLSKDLGTSLILDLSLKYAPCQL